MNTRSLRDAYCIDFLSGVSAGVLYHPLRVTADRVMAKKPFTMSPKELAKGLRYTVLSSHQLVLMGVAMSTFDKVYPQEDKTKKAVAAGCVTAFTTTPFDVCMVQKGMGKKPMVDFGLKSLYRGFTPTLFRQGILGVGFYVFPEKFPTENKVAASVAAGSAAAVLSHVFDMTRVKMQQDVKGERFPRFRDALWHTLTQESSKTVALSLAARFAIVAVAAFGMNRGKEAWGDAFDNWRKK